MYLRYYSCVRGNFPYVFNIFNQYRRDSINVTSAVCFYTDALLQLLNFVEYYYYNHVIVMTWNLCFDVCLP